VTLLESGLDLADLRAMGTLWEGVQYLIWGNPSSNRCLHTDTALVITKHSKDQSFEEQFVKWVSEARDESAWIPSAERWIQEILLVWTKSGVQPVSSLPAQVSDIYLGFAREALIGLRTAEEQQRVLDDSLPDARGERLVHFVATQPQRSSLWRQGMQNAYLALTSLFSYQEAVFYETAERMSLHSDLVELIGQLPYPKKWKQLAHVCKATLPRLATADTNRVSKMCSLRKDLTHARRLQSANSWDDHGMFRLAAASSTELDRMLESVCLVLREYSTAVAGERDIEQQRPG